MLSVASLWTVDPGFHTAEGVALVRNDTRQLAWFDRSGQSRERPWIGRWHHHPQAPLPGVLVETEQGDWISARLYQNSIELLRLPETAHRVALHHRLDHKRVANTRSQVIGIQRLGKEVVSAQV